MTIHDRKEISVDELEVGMELQGYKDKTTNMSCLSTLIVAEINDNEIKLNNCFGELSKTLTNPSNYVFIRELTEAEYNEKYSSDVLEIKNALNNKLAQVEGCHEMYNGWLYAGTLTDIASKLKDDGMQIIGYATLSVPKVAMFSGEMLDIGVVAEYLDDGDRIWCHCSDSYRKELLNRNF